jgi:DNA-binding CsgD family transcriptional regulator
MSGLKLTQFLSLISRDGNKSTISARINMQKAKHQVSKLNMDIARQIRQDERMAKELAQEYKVSISTIRHIRKNIMYVDHQNPWSQLLRGQA